jgi:hypothetical protein
VEVQTPATFDAELRSRRDTLKARLGRGDVAGALACVHSSRRAEYARMFDEIFVENHARVDDVLTSIPRSTSTLASPSTTSFAPTRGTAAFAMRSAS